MAKLDRRTFLRSVAATAGGVALGGPLEALVAQRASAKPPSGGLAAVPDLRDGIVRLHVRDGFQYRSFHDTDGPPIMLPDGTRLPGRHDGMAAFPGPDGNVWLVRNHEVNNPGPAFGPSDPPPYDTMAQGGTTTTLVTPDGIPVDAFTSLNGTQMNCSGGPMPWGSWVTCEETVNGPDVGADFTGVPNTPLQKPHGFIFEVPAGGRSSRSPIMHAGRFAHEAAAFSPDDGNLYLTEDNFAFPSGFYRYVPPSSPMVTGVLEDGGRLQMLKVVGVDQAHLEQNQALGQSYPIEWVDIDEPFPGDDGLFTGMPTNNQAIVFVGDQGRARGAAGFSRLEGATFAKGEVYFTSTQGGGAAETGPELDAGYGNGTGQVWSYSPRRATLTCRYQAPDAAALELPDNITHRNNRGSIVICEDGPVENYVRRLDANGQLTNLVLNQLRRNAPPFAPRFGEEFAGATFSPDGHTMFVNIQAAQGITFAIWGPWGRLGV